MDFSQQIRQSMFRERAVDRSVEFELGVQWKVTVPDLSEMAVVVLSLAFQRRWFSYAAVRGKYLPDWIRMTTI